MFTLKELLQKASEVDALKSQRGILERFYELFISGDIPDGDFLEIGTFMGKTTVFLSLLIEQQFPESKFYTIDPYTQAGFKDFSNPSLQAESTYNHFLKHTDGLSNHTHFKDYSQNVRDEIKDGSISFAFIDGDHSYKGALNDYNNYVDKVRVGGVIVFDDYRNPKFGVKKAVNEILKDPRVEFISAESKEIYFRRV
jgi:hypothetical protein